MDPTQLMAAYLALILAGVGTGAIARANTGKPALTAGLFLLLTGAVAVVLVAGPALLTFAFHETL